MKGWRNSSATLVDAEDQLLVAIAMEPALAWGTRVEAKVSESGGLLVRTVGAVLGEQTFSFPHLRFPPRVHLKVVAAWVTQTGLDVRIDVEEARPWSAVARRVLDALDTRLDKR